MKNIQPTATNGKVKESKNENINKRVMVEKWFQIPMNWHSALENLRFESGHLHWDFERIEAGHNEAGLRQKLTTPL